jgi:hypothetical protein
LSLYGSMCRYTALCVAIRALSAIRDRHQLAGTIVLGARGSRGRGRVGVDDLLTPGAGRTLWGIEYGRVATDDWSLMTDDWLCGPLARPSVVPAGGVISVAGPGARRFLTD